MVKKSKGFSWGPAATGCSYWTGVRMSTLLRMAGVHTPDQARAQGLRLKHPKPTYKTLNLKAATWLPWRVLPKDP